MPALRAVTFALPDWFRVGQRQRPTYMDYRPWPREAVDLPTEWSVTIFDVSPTRDEEDAVVIEMRGDRTGAIEIDKGR